MNSFGMIYYTGVTTYKWWYVLATWIFIDYDNWPLGIIIIINFTFRASPTYNTILVLKLHYFSVILALNFFVSPTITPNVYTKKEYSSLLYY